MARIRPLTKDEVAASVHPILEQAEHALGKPLIPVGIQAYCPPILEASTALGQAPARSHKLRCNRAFAVESQHFYHPRSSEPTT